MLVVWRRIRTKMGINIRPSKLFMFGFLLIAVFGFVVGYYTKGIFFGLILGCGGSILFTLLDLINICVRDSPKA